MSAFVKEEFKFNEWSTLTTNKHEFYSDIQWKSIEIINLLHYMLCKGLLYFRAIDSIVLSYFDSMYDSITAFHCFVCRLWHYVSGFILLKIQQSVELQLPLFVRWCLLCLTGLLQRTAILKVCCQPAIKQLNLQNNGILIVGMCVCLWPTWVLWVGFWFDFWRRHINKCGSLPCHEGHACRILGAVVGSVEHII